MGSKIPAICTPSDAKRVLRLPEPVRFYERPPHPRRGELYRSLNPGGQLHNESGPAIEFEDGSYEWWRNGRVHRDDDLPALHIEYSNSLSVLIPSGCNWLTEVTESVIDGGTDVWCCDGYPHRDTLPAMSRPLPNGGLFEQHWQHGRMHNASGPALTTPEITVWFYHGLFHNDAGPAYCLIQDGNLLADWYWYGDLLMLDGEMQPSFPFCDAPPAYLLKALQVAKFSDNLIRSLLLMQPYVFGQMPDFQQHIANCCDDISWALFQGYIRNALNAGEVQESYDYSFAL